jgi:hypothetical protein
MKAPRCQLMVTTPSCLSWARLADGASADAEAVGDVGFVEAVAEVESATEDGLPDAVSNLLGQAPPLGRPHPLNASVHRDAILTAL